MVCLVEGHDHIDDEFCIEIGHVDQANGPMSSQMTA